MTGEHWTKAQAYTEHTTLIPYLMALKGHYRDARLAWFEVFLGLYTDCQDVAILSSRATVASSPLYAQQSVPVNLTRPLIDTAEAKIAGSTRPRPYFKSVGASYSQRRKCQRLQKFMDGEFDRTRVYTRTSQMVKDAGIFGTSLGKIYAHNKKIHFDRVLISELIVDENLAFDSAPPELTHNKEVSKSKLKQRFPKYADKIEPLVTVGANATVNQWSELVEVYETWALPNGDEPGKHVICIEGATLLSEPWEHDYFPIVVFRWNEMPTGFYGQGIIHQVMGLQVEVSRWFRNISMGLHLLANPRVLLPNGGDLSPHHIVNAWGTILKYQPPFKPELWTSQVMPPETYQWFENMYRKAFELTGLSTQAAFAVKQPGLDSGKALREMSDIQADRLAPISVRYENLILDIAQRYIDCAEQLLEDEPDYSTVYQGDRTAERLRYSDVRMSKDDYTVQLFATAFLSRTPSAAFDDIKDLMAAQVLDPSEARSLMNFPDLQRVFDLENAARDNFERIVELMLDKGEYTAPQPYDGPEGLELGKKVMLEAYARARTESIEDEKLSLMRRFLDETIALLDELKAKDAAMQSAQQQSPAPQGMAPQQAQVAA